MTASTTATSGPGRPAFTVDGRRVLVVGAARSGLAAAELLVSRGAVVTLTDRAPSVPGEERLRAIGVELDLGGHDRRTLHRRRPHRDQSRRAARAGRAAAPRAPPASP